MIGLTTIDGKLQTSGSRYSAGAVAREAELIRQAEANVPTDFDGLARWMGYKPHLIRNAIGRATSRASVIERIRAAGYRFQGNPECLADAYLAEIAASVPSLMAAE